MPRRPPAGRLALDHAECQAECQADRQADRHADRHAERQGAPMNLEERKLEVLRAVIEDYIATEEPVGSKALAERHHLGVSPATIRNAPPSR